MWSVWAKIREPAFGLTGDTGFLMTGRNEAGYIKRNTFKMLKSRQNDKRSNENKTDPIQAIIDTFKWLFIIARYSHKKRNRG